MTGMQLVPVDLRKVYWTNGLAQMCRLLEHHECEEIAANARLIPRIVEGL